MVSERRKRERRRLWGLLLDGADEFFMDVGKMLALKVKGAVVASQYTAQDALFDTVWRDLQIAHALL